MIPGSEMADWDAEHISADTAIKICLMGLD